jgi:polyisoprenyl-phosphate glycosyltransferase
MAKTKKLITYIFPVYNNASSLPVLLETITRTMATVKQQYDCELIFVNDGSRDNSAEVLRELAEQDRRIRAFFLSRNFGHQAAVTAGLAQATGDAVIIMDADMQDPPRVCLDLIKKWEEGYEVVYAQRRSRKDGFLKKLTSDMFYRVLSSMSSINIPRNTGDFRLVDRKVVEVVNNMPEYHRYLRGMFSFAGFKQAGVLFDRDARHSGKSEYTIKKLVKLAKDGLFGFSDAPLRFVSKLGYVVSGLSLIGILYAIILRIFWSYITVPGWTMIVVAVFLMGGVQLVMLGVIGEYIARIHDEVRGRPTYIIAAKIDRKE